MFKVTLYRYQIPFTRQSKTQPHRQGYILNLKDENGIEGFGEIAPLPQFSSESLGDSLDQIRKALKTDPESLSLFPSVSFGFESAYLDILARQKECRMSEVLSPAAPRDIAINAFLSGTLDECVSQVKDAKSKGYSVFKLKVGRGPEAQDIDVIRAVNAHLDDSDLLRLDANQNWDLKSAIQVCKAVSDCKIDYVEEPVKNADDWSAFFYETGLQLALDESIQNNHDLNFSSLPEVKAIVLKPTLIGGVQSCLDIAEKAQLHQKIVVLSSSFESFVGVNVIAHLASVICPGVAHGLGTLGALSLNTVKDDALILNGRYQLLKKPFDLNLDLLEDVDLE